MGPFGADTAFFITNTDSAYQSLARKVEITVDQAGFDFSATIDTLNLESKYLLVLKGAGNLPADRTYTWLVNEDVAGQGVKLLYDYNSQLGASDFEISLSTETKNGCSYSVNHSFRIKPSPLPQVTIERPCPGENVQIIPAGGEVFNFYAGAGLQHLLHKGSRFAFENLYTDTIIYITNIDSLQESNVLTVPVYVDKFATFTQSADTLRLHETDTVVFYGFCY